MRRVELQSPSVRTLELPRHQAAAKSKLGVIIGVFQSNPQMLTLNTRLRVALTLRVSMDNLTCRNT
jgi:hypothetical protein